MVSQEVIRDSDILGSLSVRYLKVFGIWGVINDYRTTGKMNAIMKFEMLITLIFATPYIICQCISYFVIEVDIQKATFLNLHFLPAMQICSKVLVFWFRMDSMCRFYNLMRKDFLTIPQHIEAGSKRVYEKVSQKSNMFCMTAFIVNGTSIFLSVVDPGISVDYILHHTGSMAAVTGGRKKILGGWYPLPMAESPYYEAIYVYEAILITWGGFLLAVYVCLFYQILMCLYAQFALLGYQISTLKIGGSDFDRKGSNGAMCQELYAILQDHQKLLSYTNEIRSVYNPLVTMVFGMGIGVLVISVFQFLFGGTGNFLFIYKFLQFLVYQSIEVSMFCSGSSFIEKASSELQFAIYSSDWYRADTKFRKAAQMLMIRARKGETLTALRMYPVNMETIMAILQFTYTVATLMARMSE